MLRSNLPLWFDLNKVILIVCIVAHDAKMETNKFDLGILETRRDIQEESVGDQSGGFALVENDGENFKRLQFSYALSTLRHLQLTEQFLYNSNNDFVCITKCDDVISFDVEAASMLATVQSVPVRKSLEDVLWLLWFYTDNVRRLLQASSKGKPVDPMKTQSMYKVHQSVKCSLRRFVELWVGQFDDVQKKLDEIVEEEIVSDIKVRTTLICENKKLLNSQMALNEKYGLSTDDKKHISFQSITTVDRLERLEMIVVEYFGEKYWSDVGNALGKMFDTASNVDVAISYQVVYLWHIKNLIVKILKMILLTLVESYLDCASSNVTTSMNEFASLKLSQFYECLGISPYSDCSMQLFGDRCYYTNLYNDVVRNINTDKEYGPSCTKVENIFDYYSLLFEDPKMVVSKRTEKKRENLDLYVEKVKQYFSDVHVNIAKSFYLVPFAKSFEKFKEIEHPITNL